MGNDSFSWISILRYSKKAEAMAYVSTKVPNVRLAIVGGGDPPNFIDQVRICLKYFGIADRAVLTGPLIGRKKLEAFADADIFVLPSHAENFAFAMFEAMASRIPVVISSTLNFAHEVERYSAGLVVKRDSSSFLPVTKRLSTIPGLNPGLILKFHTDESALANRH